MPNIELSEGWVEVDRVPDVCPLCHVACVFFILVDRTIPAEAWKGAVLEVVFRCPRQDCSRMFVARYRYSRPGSTHPSDVPLLEVLFPAIPLPPNVPGTVGALSPSFVEVLTQAEYAEALGLLELAGVGQRKALEYLVKDYCISLHPGDAETIKGLFLGTCIERYISDKNLKACAKRAVWLGNDETHYLRRWEAHDLNDLKALVRLTVAWIDTAEQTKKYLRELPEAKR